MAALFEQLLSEKSRSTVREQFIIFAFHYSPRIRISSVPKLIDERTYHLSLRVISL